MKDPYRTWNTVTSRSKAANLILQVAPTEKILKEDYFIAKFMGFSYRGTVLDFGCGFGRNSFMLASRCGKLWAYDFPNMIKMLEEDFRFKNFNNIITSSNWEEVKKQQFDAIVCCISLQHLTKEDCIKYLSDFAEMTDNLYVNTRPHLDFKDGLIYPLLMEKWKAARIYNKCTEEDLKTIKIQYFVHLNRR